MDSAVSWQEAVLISRLRYPNADQTTILYFAKEVYLAKHRIVLKEQVQLPDKVKKESRQRFVIQGASI
jgi:hypothetical protein